MANNEERRLIEEFNKYSLSEEGVREIKAAVTDYWFWQAYVKYSSKDGKPYLILEFNTYDGILTIGPVWVFSLVKDSSGQEQFKMIKDVPSIESTGIYSSGNMLIGDLEFKPGIKIIRPIIPMIQYRLLRDDEVREIKEFWKKYDNNYEASNLGRVRNSKTKRVLVPADTGSGLSVIIRGKCVSVAKIVATAFITNMGSGPYVEHIDGDKYDNRVSNLRWNTRAGIIGRDITRERMQKAALSNRLNEDVSSEISAKRSNAARNRKNTAHVSWKNYVLEVHHLDGRVETFSHVKEYAEAYKINPSRVYPYVLSGKYFIGGKCRFKRVHK